MSSRPHPRETRIAACADYLLNVPVKTIEHRHGCSGGSVVKWMQANGQFKLRGTGVRTFQVAKERT